MEEFWAILKSKLYHLQSFDKFKELKEAIEDYNRLYNEERLQKNLNGLSPSEFRSQAC